MKNSAPDGDQTLMQTLKACGRQFRATSGDDEKIIAVHTDPSDRIRLSVRISKFRKNGQKLKVRPRTWGLVEPRNTPIVLLMKSRQLRVILIGKSKEPISSRNSPIASQSIPLEIVRRVTVVNRRKIMVLSDSGDEFIFFLSVGR